MDLEAQPSFNHLTGVMTLFGHTPIRLSGNQRVNLGLKRKALRSTMKLSLRFVSETKNGPGKDLDREFDRRKTP